MKQKRYVEMTRQEWRLATEGLNYELVGDHFTEAVLERRTRIFKYDTPLHRSQSVFMVQTGPFFTSRRYAL